jgi:hypothetical protein
MSEVFHFIQSLNRSLHTDFNCRVLRLPDLQIGLTEDVTGRQGMHTPSTAIWSHLCYTQASMSARFFLVDNIYVVFGDQVFQLSVGIPIGTNCAPLLADLFLYSYEAKFVQKLLQDNNKKKTSRVVDISMMSYQSTITTFTTMPT